MAWFLTSLLVLDAFVLITAVLLQAGTGGGLAAMGGGASTDSFLGGRQATTILTKLSWWCGGIFLGLSLILSGVTARGGGAQSILQGTIDAPAPISTGVNPLPLDVPGTTPPAATGDSGQ